MKSRQKTGQAMLAGALPAGKPPTEFRIFAAGVNDTDYGPFLFDDVAGAMVMQDFRTINKGPLKFDFNHGMAKPYPTAEEGKSAGTFVPEVRNGELWATDCQWTEEAARRIEAREYENYSPLFKWDWAEGLECPRITKLLNCALVNIPGLHNIQSIAAAANLTGDDSMETEALLKKTQDELAAANKRNDALASELSEAKARTGTVALAGALGLTGVVTSEQTVAVAGQLFKFRGDVLALTGVAEAPAALGVISGWREKAASADRLSADAEAREATALAADVEVALAEGVKGMTIESAKDGKQRMMALRAAFGPELKFTRDGLAYLKGQIPNMPKLVGSADGGAGGAKPPGGIQALNGIGAEIVDQFGWDEAKKKRFAESQQQAQ